MSFPPKDLFSAVGLLILNFGSLEYLTFDFLQKELSAVDYARASKLHFNERLDRCFELLAATRPRATTRGGIEEIRRRLKPVRELRNHIVHGYLLVKIDPTSHRLSLWLSNPRESDIIDSEQSKHMSLGEVLLLLEELGEVQRSFEEMLGYTHTTYSINS